MMDRASRREKARVEAKFNEKCSACRQLYESKPCFATYSGTYRGHWVRICHECKEKGLIEEIHGVGIYTTGDENAPGFRKAVEVLGPLLRSLEASGQLVRQIPAEQQEEIRQAFAEEDPSAKLFFLDRGGRRAQGASRPAGERRVFRVTCVNEEGVVGFAGESVFDPNDMIGLAGTLHDVMKAVGYGDVDRYDLEGHADGDLQPNQLRFVVKDRAAGGAPVCSILVEQGEVFRGVH